MTVRAVLVHDYDLENPFVAWDTLGSLMMCSRGSRGTVTVSDLGDFCNSKFDEDFVLYDLYTEDPYAVAEYARSCGALTSTVDGGLVIVGHDQIMKEYGYDNAKSRKLAQTVIDAEARAFSEWMNGDTYGIILLDDGEEDTSEIYIDVGDYDDDEVVDSLFGFYGYDSAYDEAERMIRERRASKMKTLTDRQSKAKADAKAYLAMNSKRGSKSKTKPKSASVKIGKSAKSSKTKGVR